MLIKRRNDPETGASWLESPIGACTVIVPIYSVEEQVRRIAAATGVAAAAIRPKQRWQYFAEATERAAIAYIERLRDALCEDVGPIEDLVPILMPTGTRIVGR
jgi:hypothetical protein